MHHTTSGEVWRAFEGDVHSDLECSVLPFWDITMNKLDLVLVLTKLT